MIRFWKAACRFAGIILNLRTFRVTTRFYRFYLLIYFILFQFILFYYLLLNSINAFIPMAASIPRVLCDGRLNCPWITVPTTEARALRQSHGITNRTLTGHHRSAPVSVENAH